jgi:hypothetical protein
VYETKAQVDSIDEKNQRSKISCYCPFKYATQQISCTAQYQVSYWAHTRFLAQHNTRPPTEHIPDFPHSSIPGLLCTEQVPDFLHRTCQISNTTLIRFPTQHIPEFLHSTCQITHNHTAHIGFSAQHIPDFPEQRILDFLYSTYQKSCTEDTRFPSQDFTFPILHMSDFTHTAHTRFTILDMTQHIPDFQHSQHQISYTADNRSLEVHSRPKIPKQSR